MIILNSEKYTEYQHREYGRYWEIKFEARQNPSYKNRFNCYLSSQNIAGFNGP
jgi:hypothetical protein